MCSRFFDLSKQSAKALAKPYKVGLVSLLLLLFVVSSAWAWFPSTKASQQDPLLVVPAEIMESVEEMPETSSTVSSENSEKPLAEQLEDFRNQLTSSKKVSNEIKENYDALMEALVRYFTLEEAEDAIEEENAKKLDEITKLLKKEQGNKPFATIGCVVGFDNGIDLGISSTFGMRFGKGLVASAGLQYMFGPIGNMDFSTDKSKLQVVGSVGWEW